MTPLWLWRRRESFAHLFNADVPGAALSACGDRLRSHAWKLANVAGTAAHRRRTPCPTCLERERDPQFTISIMPVTLGHLRALLAVGLFGATLEEVIERLMLEAMREKMREGWMDPKPRRPR